MKRWLCLFLTLAMLLFSVALAEEDVEDFDEFEEYAETEDFDESDDFADYDDYDDYADYVEEYAEFADIDGAQTLRLDEEYSLDIDGDGSDEFVRVQMDSEDAEEFLTLQIETDEDVFTYDTSIIYPLGAYAVDLDGDGKLEILLSGDEASSDYFTWCLCLDEEQGIRALEFADANRGENTDGYFDSGYGRLDAIEGSALTLSGTQDALGTWMCSRVFTLRDGRFELDDGGVWKMADVSGDAEAWEYHSLALVRDLNVTLEDGSAATLHAGDKFVITETDKRSYVDFVTIDGVRGRILVEPDTDEGWGYKIDGVGEAEYFEYVPYAD